MSDVAARAGVSHQTVSRVINGTPTSRRDTASASSRAIRELGYRPNTAARALVTGSTRTLGFVTVNINQYGPAQTLVGLEQAARAAGYSLAVTVLDEATAEAMRDAVDRFVAQSVDAVLALATYDDAAEALHLVHTPLPLVTVQSGGAVRSRRSVSTRSPVPGWSRATCSTSGTAPSTTSPARPTRRRRGTASAAGRRS
jgi:DNA-binding LacI/PurR family transcriptional regulator